MSDQTSPGRQALEVLEIGSWEGRSAIFVLQDDAVQSWPMVREGGIVIFDDCEWSFFPEKTGRPMLGVDRFQSVRPR
jgi:predicted O-methyltransferase YrrM